MGDHSVTMFHPPSERTQRASADAFERVWAAEGWQLVDESDRPPAPDGPPAPDAVDRLDALRAEAESLGVKVRRDAKPETLERKIAEVRAASAEGDE